jgi:four helix bundle protein
MELEESGYWLELLADAEIIPADRLAALQDEVSQLTAILVIYIKNARQKGDEAKSRKA